MEPPAYDGKNQQYVPHDQFGNNPQPDVKYPATPVGGAAYPSQGQTFNSPQPYTPYPSAPAGGAAYYSQAQSAPMFPAPNQQQQQQSSVVVLCAGNSAPVIVQAAPFESYTGYIAFACIVFWLCNWLFGLIAFILISELAAVEFIKVNVNFVRT